MVDYKINAHTGELDRVGGSGGIDVTKFVTGETPTPSPNASQTVFTVANAYVAGTLRVTRGSLRMHPTADFTETSPTTFTMVVAPDAVEPLIVDYIKP